MLFKIKLEKFLQTKDAAKFTQAMDYLEASKKSFGIELDYQKQVVNSLLIFRHTLEKEGKQVEKSWYMDTFSLLFKIIRQNYYNVSEEYQSIFNLHELLISLAVDYAKVSKCELKAITPANLLYKMYEASQKVEGREGTFMDEYLGKEDGEELIVHLFSSFTFYKGYGMKEGEEDKSNNAHNCRKFSTLSSMYLLHKLMHVCGCGRELNSELKNLFLTYARAYIELTSVVTDLQMYVAYLSEQQRKEIMESLQNQIDTKPNYSEARKAKAHINLNKLANIFRSEFHPSLDAFKAHLGELSQQFFAFLKLDDKPEKGERKFADEQALLIAEVVDMFILGSKGDLKQEDVSQLELFKICLLELAFEQSNYNFDIQLALMKSFERVGACTSYSESYDNLGIKGVQLESLGFLSLRHSLSQLNFSLTSKVQQKQWKYLTHNAQDLSDMKVKALQDFNYGQLENFIEYEGFLAKSYFAAFEFEYYERMRQLFSNFVNGTQLNIQLGGGDSHYSSGVDLIEQGMKYEQLS
mmetsp:Transcript_8641/g.14628  ORF Transcript_8641/g.14628 Transcript_8641/m.14628 type:complete len:524 (+) Transcript_8641:690-2261(+)